MCASFAINNKQLLVADKQKIKYNKSQAQGFLHELLRMQEVPRIQERLRTFSNQFKLLKPFYLPRKIKTMHKHRDGELVQIQHVQYK